MPIHPELSNMLIEHLKEFGAGPGGRVFIGPRGCLMTDRAYLKVFHSIGDRLRNRTPPPRSTAALSP
ncbi:hypothetical protein [Nonomuraea sp. KM88]|uniref:hypothetical protein n=1 Tax=Nonomuraea sp. KM88 TaxID=3457427 RepID=UPI003FCC7D34